MDSDTGWRRSAGESSGRWRTILGGAGRARVPGQPEAVSPEPDADSPAAARPPHPDGPPTEYPGGSTYSAAASYSAGGYPGGQSYPAAAASGGQSYPAAAAPGGQPYPGAQPGPQPYQAAPGGQTYSGAAPYQGAPQRPAAHPNGQPASYPAAVPAQYPAAQPSAYPTAQPGSYPAPAGGQGGYPPAGYPAPGYSAPGYPQGTPYPPQPGYGPGPAPTPGRPTTLPPPSPTLPVAGHERAVAMLRRPLSGSKVIAFANPKGGVHKTTATVLTAAAIGGARGGSGVLAWDDNELRGTLGLRAGSARHAKTIRHLLAELAEVELNSGAALVSRIDDFLRHANDGSYDVLAGEEDPRFSWRLDPPTVRRVLDLLTRTHEIICVDTGNNVESGNWRTIMEAADQLVITTVPREDSAFSADWMMDVLVTAGREDLVANAVTLVSMTTPRPGPMHDDLVRHFRGRNRAVCVVPYDPVLEQGGWIDHTMLAPTTREAWLEAAAVIMEPLAASA